MFIVDEEKQPLILETQKKHVNKTTVTTFPRYENVYKLGCTGW
jgi:hypothetical protein